MRHRLLLPLLALIVSLAIVVSASAQSIAFLELFDGVPPQTPVPPPTDTPVATVTPGPSGAACELEVWLDGTSQGRRTC